MKHLAAVLISLFLLGEVSFSQDSPAINQSLFDAFTFRSPGPALTSGRIIDFAVNPVDPSEYYVGVACGGVWKTTNAGISYQPIFDKQNSFSIGCVTIDPTNSHTVWVGTGENNSQRSVSYGDGVYKSEDGGASWKCMGLSKSEHIGKILIDPSNGDVVYVAAQGPLWGPGGERGLYKSMDGGQTWKSILSISENTGVTDIAFDPRDSKVIYAASYQRRRHVWTLINGGEESAIYKSRDGGVSWQKLSNGLPAGELGRIGIAVSPVNPDFVYALIEASGKKGGFFKSEDRGASWSKMNDIQTVSAQYYQEIFCDPKEANKVYSVDTYTKCTMDGGKTWTNLGLSNRHVDDHAIWIDPRKTEHLLIGGDGGIYESYDGGKNWDFKENLPVTQFYRVSVDHSKPFYRIYGGTQDNASIGGPSRTLNSSGISNFDWFITLGGDGFETQVDPTDPNIVYSQSQHGYLNRINLETGERIKIQPMEGIKDQAYRWNWDSPFIISPHNPSRLYFACNYLFKSDDQGNSWSRISPDLTRQLNRDLLPVMGKIQSVDAVAKNASTSQYGNIVSLSESPLKEGLIYTGTDDGLIQVTEDDGKTWKKYEQFKDVPEMTYVSCLFASRLDENVVYALFNNHKRADFKPYLLKSSNKGKTWESIASNLPENFPLYSFQEDFVKKDLLFVGGEFGLYVSVTGGKEWFKMSSGLPAASIKDIEIQQDECDLVLATFGRGFYILDNYAPLREISTDMLSKKAYLFTIEEGLMFMEKSPLGGGLKGDQGENFFNYPNPAIEQSFWLYLLDKPKSLKDLRIETEAQAIKDKKDISYPDWSQLKEEDTEKSPYLLISVFDETGFPVRTMKKSYQAGIQRISWDFRYNSVSPVTAGAIKENGGESGQLALPGMYQVKISLVHENEITELIPATPFRVNFLQTKYSKPQEMQALDAFVKDLNQFIRVFTAFEQVYQETQNRVQLLEGAVYAAKELHPEWLAELNQMKDSLFVIKEALYGDETKTSRNYEVAPGLRNRVWDIVYGLWNSQSAPTRVANDSYAVAKQQFTPVYGNLKTLVEKSLPAFESKLDKIQAPHTPGRFPIWNRD